MFLKDEVALLDLFSSIRWWGIDVEEILGEFVDLQVLFRVKWLQTQEKLNEKIIYHFPALIVRIIDEKWKNIARSRIEEGIRSFCELTGY